MHEVESPELVARTRAEVDRAVAPYEGVAPPFMVTKLRELAERYWRENPVAARALQLKGYTERARSGEETTAPEENAGDDAKEA
jgi:hypothetical protein